MGKPKAQAKKTQKRGVDFKVMIINSFICLGLIVGEKGWMEVMWQWILKLWYFFFFEQKIKRKIGRKLPPPKNATSTEIKSKAIVLPEQSIASEKAGLAVSKKGLTLKELLQHAGHHNTKVRKGQAFYFQLCNLYLIRYMKCHWMNSKFCKFCLCTKGNRPTAVV